MPAPGTRFESRVDNERPARSLVRRRARRFFVRAAVPGQGLYPRPIRPLLRARLASSGLSNLA